MNETIFMVEEWAEGGYLIKAIGESIFTEANTSEELYSALHDAVKCYFDEDTGVNNLRIIIV